MTIRKLTVLNEKGLHARAAALLVHEASRFASEITMEKEGLKINAKSIMNIFMLMGTKGSLITVEADGPDEEAAVGALEALFLRKFGEE